jgi:hypothetical protein
MQKAKSFYDEMKVTDKYVYSKESNKKLLLWT